MGEGLQSGQARGPQLIRAAQVAHEAEVRQSANGVRFATYGETGVPAPDLDRMLEAVPTTIVAALENNTYFFVPLAMREGSEPAGEPRTVPDQPMVAGAYTDEYGDAAICHRNVELGSGHRGVFISTRLMSGRFLLSFEFFINVAHAFVDRAGVSEAFANLVWQQAVDNVRGETSQEAWESRNLAFGRPANGEPEAASSPRRNRAFALAAGSFPAQDVSPAAIDEKERTAFLEAAFADAIAIYLLSLALDFEYGELREREYPLLAPAALAARLRLISELFPPNPGYEFAVRYRRRA
ncbi:MAG TPA: hypothetical protein VGN16_06775 [Acidobacteriaceae bacterium]|jgi:hypothetical protein